MCVCVNTGVCASRLCLILPHVHWNQMRARIWNLKASHGSGEWHSLETTDLESMAPSWVCERGGGNLKSTRLWNPCRRAVSSAFLICVASGLDPSTRAPGKTLHSWALLNWAESDGINYAVHLEWRMLCFLDWNEKQEVLHRRGAFQCKENSCFRSLLRTQMCTSPVGIRITIIPVPVYLVFLKR